MPYKDKNKQKEILHELYLKRVAKAKSTQITPLITQDVTPIKTIEIKNTPIVKPIDNYVHKTGGDQFCSPPPGYKGNAKWMNINGFRYMIGIGRSPLLMIKIQKLKKNQESCVMVITGRPGKGKSYIALRLAQEIDRRFDVKKQLIYDRKALLNAIGEDSSIQRGQVLIVDEAQFAMASRNWSDSLQKDLMAQMQAVRSKGLIIIIVTLGISLIDNIMRDYIMSWHIDVESRGVGTVYEYNKDKFTDVVYHKFLTRINEPLPGYEQCKDLTSCLICKKSGLLKGEWANKDKWGEGNFIPCPNIRAVYERHKKAYVDGQNKASIVKADIIENKHKVINFELVYNALINGNPLPLNTKGNWRDADMKVKLNEIDEFKGMNFSRDNLNILKTMGKQRNPELFTKS